MRFGQILGRDGNAFAVIQVANGAAIYCVGYCAPNLLLEAADETLAINRTLFLAVEAPIDDADHAFLRGGP